MLKNLARFCKYRVYLNKQNFFIFLAFYLVYLSKPLSLCKQNRKTMTIEKLAFLICQYNGQKGTEKQVDKCIKMFGGCINLMQQWCKGRINL